MQYKGDAMFVRIHLSVQMQWLYVYTFRPERNTCMYIRLGLTATSACIYREPECNISMCIPLNLYVMLACIFREPEYKFACVYL